MIWANIPVFYLSLEMCICSKVPKLHHRNCRETILLSERHKEPQSCNLDVVREDKKTKALSETCYSEDNSPIQISFQYRTIQI